MERGQFSYRPVDLLPGLPRIDVSDHPPPAMPSASGELLSILVAAVDAGVHMTLLDLVGVEDLAERLGQLRDRRVRRAGARVQPIPAACVETLLRRKQAMQS